MCITASAPRLSLLCLPPAPRPFRALFGRPSSADWFYKANPLAYALEALVTPQFYCPASTLAAGGCPSIQVPLNGALVNVPIYSYLTSVYGLDYSRRWEDVGILFAFIGGIMALAALSLRCLTFIKR